MAIINRVSRLFRSDFNAVLDRIEEPGLLLKQAVREMEEDIQNNIQQLKVLENEHLQLDKKISSLQQDISGIDQELDICFENNEMELARDRVKRKIELQNYEKSFSQKAQSVLTSKTSLESRVNDNQARLQAMRQKLELFEQTQQDNSHDEFSVNMVSPVSENEIEMGLLKEKQARSMS